MASQQHDMSSYTVNGKPVSQLKVDELKEELEKRGLKKSGVKKDLVERLCEDMDKQQKATEDTDVVEQKPTETEESRSEEVVEEEKTEEVINDQQENENKNGQIEDGEISEEQKEPEKERKISLAKLKSTTTPVSSTRKRRWSSNKKKSSVVISSDSLKELIPGVQLASTPALEAVMDFDDDKDDEEEDEITQEQEEKGKENEDVENEEDGEHSSAKKTRIVQVEQSRTVRLKNTASLEDEISDVLNESNISTNDKDLSNITQGSMKVDEELSSDNKFKPDRQVSPPRNAPSNILHVCNLVRPFTQKQLDQLLVKYGAVVEGGFWINKIKSHCYVTYSSVEEASAGRSALHGQRWPATSPKILNVDFADDDQMFEDTDGVLGKPKESETKKEDEKQEEEKVKVKEHKKHKEKKESKATDENAANLLDKLFRKTVTEPHIYWLPLTKEQIIARDIERKERRKQRLAQKAQENQKDDRLRERQTDPRGRQEVRSPVKARESAPRVQERKPFRETPPQQRRSYSDRRSPDVPRRRSSPPSRDNRGRR